MKTIATVLIVTLIAGCAPAPDIQVRYAEPTPSSGALDVALNAATGHLTVVIDGDLVIDRKPTRKAHIDSVPAGIHRVSVVTSGACEDSQTHERNIEIRPGATTTFAIAAPRSSTACEVGLGLYWVGLSILSVAIAIVVAAMAQPRPRH